MNYSEVLTRAWKIIWKFKVLWIFGILASCGRGGGGNGGGNSGSGVQYNQPSSSLPPELQRLIGNPEQFFQEYWWVLALAVGLICLLVILSIFLSTIGKIGLVKGTMKAEAGADSMGFGEIWSESLPYFWRIFLLNLLIGLVIFFVIMSFVLIAAIAGALTFGLALICLIPFICLLVPVIWAISVVIEQATAAIVIEDLGVMDGLRRGWDVVKANWTHMLVMAIVLILGIGIISFLLALPLLMVILAAVVPMAFSGGSQSIQPILIIMLACLCAYLPILIVANGILTAYSQTAWALTYMRLAGHKPQSQTDALDIPDTPPFETVNG